MKRCNPSPALTKEWLDDAHGDLEASAALIAVRRWSPSYRLSYDATRKCCAAFLQAQGLRVSGQAGHHAAVVKVVAAQIGHVMGKRTNDLEAMRRTRNALDYPVDHVAAIGEVDARNVWATARGMHALVTGITETGALRPFAEAVPS